MKNTLQQILFSAGKELYKFRELPCPQECLMGWGICCPDKWFKPLLTLTRILEHHNQLHPEDTIHARQVKSKFGQLRYYTDRPHNENDFLVHIISVFEEMLSSAQFNDKEIVKQSEKDLEK